VNVPSLHARLPRLAAGAARLATRLLAALDGLAVGEAVLKATATRVPPEGGWIVFDSEPGRILLRPVGADPLAAVQALEPVEPLVGAIERALGVELMPVSLVARPAPDAVVLALTLGTARAWLAVAPDVALAPARRAVRLPGAFGPVRVPVAVRLTAPALSVPDLAALAPGDLLLCLAGASATLTMDDRLIHARLTKPPIAVRIEAASRLSETQMTLDTQVPPAPSPEADLGRIAVPLTIALDGITLPLATIAGLAEGSVIELGRAGTSLPVRLLVGEQIVATGELIAVGDGYGVLVKARA